MKKFAIFFAAALCVAVSVFAGERGRYVAPSDPRISYMGRIHWGDSIEPEFNFPGVTARFAFEGTGLSMAARPGSGQFMVEIDSIKPFKINFTKNDSLITLADGLDERCHNVRVTYAIEGYEHNPSFRGFYISEGGRMLPAPAPGKMKIEFIGNSITCGYGLETDDPTQGFSYDSENHCLSYAFLTARNLDAEVNVVARSGIGMYRNYGGPREGTDLTMPDEYSHTMLYDSNKPWDFSRFQPDVVCVNLGTNDTSLDNYDIGRYERATEDFVNRLTGYYPGARIVLLTGSMMNGRALDDVKSALDRVASAHPGVVSRFDMTPQDGQLGYGADYHPSAAQARLMADELTAFLRTILQ